VDGVGAWVGAHRRWLWAVVIAAATVVAWKLYLPMDDLDLAQQLLSLGIGASILTKLNKG
jgi:hypothetical protein